jgi:hypothetical protein
VDLAAKTERNSSERRFVVDPIGFSKIDSTETGESPEIEGFTTSTDSTETRESAERECAGAIAVVQEWLLFNQTLLER